MLECVDFVVNDDGGGIISQMQHVFRVVRMNGFDNTALYEFVPRKEVNVEVDRVGR